MASPAHGRTLAVVGATGLVGQAIIRGLAARKFPVKTLLPVASARSKGMTVEFKGQDIPVLTLEEALERKPDLALFSAVVCESAVGQGLHRSWSHRRRQQLCLADGSECAAGGARGQCRQH